MLLASYGPGFTFESEQFFGPTFIMGSFVNLALDQLKSAYMLVTYPLNTFHTV